MTTGLEGGENARQRTSRVRMGRECERSVENAATTGSCNDEAEEDDDNRIRRGGGDVERPEFDRRGTTMTTGLEWGENAIS